MSERKNIDRLFQEKFKDFEVNPPEAAWTNIEAKLDEKKKRRVIPFWWKLSGVAALFLIGLLIFKSVSGNEIKPGNTVVNSMNSNTTKQSTSQKGLKNSSGIKTDNAIVNSTNPNVPKEHVNKKQLENNGGIKTENAVANENDPSNKTKQKISNDFNKKGFTNDSEAVATTSNDFKNNTGSERRNKIKKDVYSSNGIAERKSSGQHSLKNKANPEKNKTVLTGNVFEKLQNQMAQNTKDTKSDKEIIQDNEAKKATSPDQKNINLDGLKGDTNSKIVAQETAKKVNDTTAKKGVVSNALEELLNEKESKLKQESKRTRWQLTSNVAPVFLGSAAKGSPIDSTLSKNSKSYNTHVGYGIGVSYAVSKKVSVRTGLNKVNMSYDTNNIEFFTGIQSKTLNHVTPTTASAMIHVQPVGAVSTTTSSENGLLPFENSYGNKNDGYLNQEMGYLEMPVEMTYTILDKKFGIKILGGFSTLFLQDNSITIVSEGRETVLGEANNLNNVHFSTNLGLGLKYGFMKYFEFNVEPTLKYQLNTFSGNAGDFKPYLFGIYSGISYKF